MTSKRASVFIDGLEEQPVLCGEITLDAERRHGAFCYNPTYLSRANAFALDPLNLPLSSVPHTAALRSGLFGVFTDAAADAWGKKVYSALHHDESASPLQFLLACSGTGVGSLLFTTSDTPTQPVWAQNTLSDLPQLIQGKNALLQSKPLPIAAKNAFANSFGLGGARPKAQVTDKGLTYIAKFNRPDDAFNQVRVEHACMRMQAELGIKVANTRVETIHGEDVLLVQRFDRNEQQRPTHHFISAHALFNMDSVSPAHLTGKYSYGFLAEFLLAQNAPEDAHELYRRMVFNVLIGNTDDHSRNHALLYDFSDKKWQLSPAYDVLPINNSRQHGLGIGDFGRDGSIENLLSQAARFNLSELGAQRIIRQTYELVAEWPLYFDKLGVKSKDRECLLSVIPSY
ncbi:MAG: HipA domain-containing protein [Opitutales bacterium]|nr:HipA domain-containing protein [Opitutales bacterium]